jgi:hypothetical protein
VRQHGASDSGGFAKQNLPNEKHRKMKQSERLSREEIESGKALQTSKTSAMLQTTPLTCERNAT